MELNAVIEMGKVLIRKDIALARSQKELLRLQLAEDERQDNVFGVAKTLQVELDFGTVTIAWDDPRGALEVIEGVKKATLTDRLEDIVAICELRSFSIGRFSPAIRN